MQSQNVIGENVVRIRSARGDTQKALAERAQLSRLGLSHIEPPNVAAWIDKMDTLQDEAEAKGGDF